MRTTLALDDELLAEAQRLTGTTEKSALIREALRALIQRESASRLARLGVTEPALSEIPRRRREDPRTWLTRPAWLTPFVPVTPPSCGCARTEKSWVPPC